MDNYAVLTGDIINFTTLPGEARKKLVEDAEKLLRSWAGSKDDAQFFRGDSYQLLLKDIPLAVRRSIQLICWFIKHSDEQSPVMLSTRIAIGIGEVAYRGKTVLDSDGTAFHQSGRSFDEMDPNRTLVISTGDKSIDGQLEIILILMNALITKLSVNQAEVVYLALEDYTQKKMADELGIQQSAVHNRLKLANWKELELGMNYVINLINI